MCHLRSRVVVRVDGREARRKAIEQGPLDLGIVTLLELPEELLHFDLELPEERDGRHGVGTSKFAAKSWLDDP